MTDVRSVPIKDSILPISSVRQRIESIGKTFYKGAPERLLAKATKYLDGDGQIKEIDQKALNQKIDSLAAKAMRVLAFGYSEKELVKNQINDDLVIIGLVAIRDDVRPSAKDAIRQVQEAGIQVVRHRRPPGDGSSNRKRCRIVKK